MSTILKFYETAKEREFARDFQFRVVSLGPLTEDDLVYIRSADLPGKEIQVHQVPYMGLDFNIPGSVKFTGSDSWKVTFLHDEGANIRSKLDAWINEIFNIESSSGKYGVPSEEATIDLIDKSFKPIRRYNLIGIFIKDIQPIRYDITGTGKPLEFDATLSYQFWRPI